MAIPPRKRLIRSESELGYGKPDIVYPTACAGKDDKRRRDDMEESRCKPEVKGTRNNLPRDETWDEDDL